MDEVQAFVRQHDQDRYLASLFAPEEKRGHLLALYAFHAEVARIAGLVSEPQLAEIRLQWWLDTLEGLYAGEVQAHPMAKALGEAIKVGDIPKFALANMAKAHQFDFYSDPMPSLNDLEGYLGETSGALVRLGAMILDQDAAQECGEAAGLAGVTYGLAQVLNNLPRAQALKQCFVPAEILERLGLEAHNLAVTENEAAAQEAVAEIRVLAERRLGELHTQSRTIKETVAPAFLHIVLAKPYLAKAKSRGAAVLTRGAEISQLRKQWVLWKAARNGLF
jgi:15-cis-phytoene synthase